MLNDKTIGIKIDDKWRKLTRKELFAMTGPLSPLMGRCCGNVDSMEGISES